MKLKTGLLAMLAVLTFPHVVIAENFGSSNSVSVDCYGVSKNCVFKNYADSARFCTFTIYTQSTVYADGEVYEKSGAFRVEQGQEYFVENIPVSAHEITRIDISCNSAG